MQTFLRLQSNYLLITIHDANDFPIEDFESLADQLETKGKLNKEQ